MVIVHTDNMHIYFLLILTWFNKLSSNKGIVALLYSPQSFFLKHT